MGRRANRRNTTVVDGFLVVDKLQDWTSHDVVGLLRSRYKLAKVGHGGTLDPMATGVLVILLGKGTKWSQRVMDGTKVYEGTVTLGVRTNTLDADGQVTDTQDPSGITREMVENAIEGFIGDIEQIPPMVSAIKKDGVPLYKLARKGEEIAREPRKVTIFSFDLLDWRPPEFDFRVKCTKGTYIRTLADDIGTDLGCGGHLSRLRRTKSGDFSIEGAPVASCFKEENIDLEGFKRFVTPLPEAEVAE